MNRSRLKKIVLASGSLWRKKLLAKIVEEFIVDPSDVDETLPQGKKIEQFLKHLSYLKAATVAKRHENAVVIGADTIGYYNGKVIGKPKTAKEAFHILKLLQGKMHYALTAFTVIDTRTKKRTTKLETVRVVMSRLSNQEIRNYIRKEKPFSAAGAYQIQQYGGQLFEKIEGDFYAVIGLPLCSLRSSLKRFGVKTII